MESLELLNLIIELFKTCRSNDEILKQLKKQNIIQSSIQQRYIKNNISFDFKLIETNPRANNLIEYYLEALDGSPYKIELVFDGNWYLKSFLFQCQGCFGEGGDCGVCGGNGWGVL